MDERGELAEKDTRDLEDDARRNGQGHGTGRRDPGCEGRGDPGPACEHRGGHGDQLLIRESLAFS